MTFFYYIFIIFYICLLKLKVIIYNIAAYNYYTPSELVYAKYHLKNIDFTRNIFQYTRNLFFCEYKIMFKII